MNSTLRDVGAASGRARLLHRVSVLCGGISLIGSLSPGTLTTSLLRPDLWPEIQSVAWGLLLAFCVGMLFGVFAEIPLMVQARLAGVRRIRLGSRLILAAHVSFIPQTAVIALAFPRPD